MGIEQLSQQNLAVMSNLSAVENLGQVLRSEMERQANTDNATKVEESALKKALDGKKGKVGTGILVGLAAKLAGKMPTNKLLNNLKNEYELLYGKEDAAQDMVDISNPILKAAKNQKQGRNGGQQMADGDEALPQKATTVKDYIGAYSQMLVNGGAQTKKKLEQIENELLNDRGVSLKDLQSTKASVANSVRSEVLKQIKQAYINHLLSGTKSLAGILAKKELNGFIDYAFMNDNLGGYDFGGMDGHLQGAVDRVKEDSHRDMRDFLDDAISKEVVKKSLGKDGKAVEKEISELIKLGSKVGFDVGDFVKKIPKMKDDLGLNAIIDFEDAPNANASANNSDQREGHRYQYTHDEERDILTDKLRALYLRRAVYGDMRTVLTTQIKMVKMQNGLIKLGVKNFDEIETEGKALAKVKLFEMLNEAFEERATYAKLSGVAWKMTERKLKTVLKNLEKLGVKLSQTELDQIRDKANTKMFREAEDEFRLIQTAIEARGEIAYLTNKRKMAHEILERLAEETGFEAPGHEIAISIQEAC
ncbi:MAG: hypothetical protein U9R38_02365 [Candidatus Margulisiibacteriota bacterium]|nr:hypothetical protein [Candidatus Margulisiibacteriota bacterium]